MAASQYTNFPNGISIWGPLPGGPGVPLLPNPSASYFGSVWFVDTVNGSDGNDGRSPQAAFKTMGRAFWTDYNSESGTVGGGAKVLPNLSSNDTIYFVGTVREQLVTPLVGQDGAYLTGVSIIGMAGGGPPRDDDAAKWTYPASGATSGGALLTIRQQGWAVRNFLMTPEPNGSGGACILLPNTGSAATGEGGHFFASGMRFVGIDVTTTYGIQDSAGCGFCVVEGCQFLLLTTGIYNSGTSNAVPLGWQVVGNRFISNTNHIVMSSTSGIFRDNVFVTEATTNIDLIAVSGQGATNVVQGNTFHNAAADITISDGYQGSATDQWSNNYATDQAVYGVPA
ncbi:MAG: hypothetical protein ACOY4R_27785 [Pseudomonadota bacterium]